MKFQKKLKEFTEKLNFSETPLPFVAEKRAKKKACTTYGVRRKYIQLVKLRPGLTRDWEPAS